jgi:hypothetical protein
MANEIQIALQQAGLSVYAAVRRTNGDFWDLVPPTPMWRPITQHSTYWTNASIALSEQLDSTTGDSSGDYYGDMPAVTANATYFIEVFVKPPTSPGAADRMLDELVATTGMYWDGTNLLVNPSKCV